MYKDELLNILSQCDCSFNLLRDTSISIEIQTILCDSEEELYNKRCELTTDPFVKQKLIIDKVKYQHVAGCYIIPPYENIFTMLLLQTGNIIYDSYNYIHELAHIHNYVDYLSATKFRDYFEPFFQYEFTLWDEYNARYISTCVMYEMLYSSSTLQEVSCFIKMICDVLRNSVSEENIKSYDGVQLLGAVEAAYKNRIINNYSDYLSSIEISILKYYKNITSITEFV